jgi:hypothetical protein
MAFKKFNKQASGKQADLSVQLTVKQGNSYIKGPSFGFWSNDQGGPAYRGTLKEQRLQDVLEFLSNALEAGLPVSMAMFDNSEHEQPKKQWSGGAGGFKKPAGGFQQQQRKPNPFKQQQEEGQQDGPNFGDE